MYTLGDLYTLKSESAENEFSEYMQNGTQSDKNASIIAANAANAKPMQNRAIGRGAIYVMSSTANHVSIPITGAPTDQRTAHCKEENKGKEKREECDLQLIRPASRHCALIVHSRCILVTLCVILCVFTQLILS